MCASANTIETPGKYACCDGTITYAEFARDIEAITRISNEIFDSWQLKCVTQKDGNGTAYLTKIETKFIQLEDESDPLSCSFVYHVVYHQSYQVPCLGFNVHRQGKFHDFYFEHKIFFVPQITSLCDTFLYYVDGSSIRLSDVWNYFRKTNSDLVCKPLTEILTEMDHPVLFTPVFMLHPCQTSTLLSSLPQR